jgi:predicted Rossmann-fold nucleotide-binding protein
MPSVPEVKRLARATARRRRTIVGVMGSGKTSDPLAEGLGRMIASMGCDLLTGAGRGVMEAVSRGFFRSTPRDGLVIGIVPASVEPIDRLQRRLDGNVSYEPPPGYPNEWVELAIYTHLPDSADRGTLVTSRNHINVLTSDVIVALPGAEGTRAEMWLASQYGVPLIALGHHASVPDGVARAVTLDEVREFIERNIR